MAETPRNVTIEGARIIYRNFAGKEGLYNREGDRNFSVVLDQELAERMANDGWKVKTKPPREEGDESLYTLPVAVAYKYRPPRVILLTSRGRTTIPEEMLEVLDYADIANVDLIVRPYPWAVGGNSGIKAYLQSIYVTLIEDDLERKYADVPEYNLVGSAPAPLQIESGGRIPSSPDEIVIDDDLPWED